MFRSRVFFTDRGYALEITLPKKDGVIDESGEIQSIMIDPRLFYHAVVQHFDDLIERLRKGKDAVLEENFKKALELKKGLPRVIGIDNPYGTAT